MAIGIKWLDTKIRTMVGIAASASASADRVYRLMVGLAAGFDACPAGRPSIAAAAGGCRSSWTGVGGDGTGAEIPVGEWASIRVGKAQARTGDFAGASPRLMAGSRPRAGRVLPQRAVARALHDAGRRDEAVAALREAEATAGGIEPDFAAIGTLATALHKAGRRDEARRWADRASDAVDSTVYAYVSGSDLGTVMYGRERRLEELGTIYADLGLPAKIWPLAARCDPQADGDEACCCSLAAAPRPRPIPRRWPRGGTTQRSQRRGRAAILLGFAEGLIANSRGD